MSRFLKETTLVQTRQGANSISLTLPADYKIISNLSYDTRVKIYLLDNLCLLIEPVIDENPNEMHYVKEDIETSENTMKKFLCERRLARAMPEARSILITLPAEYKRISGLPFGTKVRIYLLNNFCLLIEPVIEKDIKEQLHVEEEAKIQ